MLEHAVISTALCYNHGMQTSFRALGHPNAQPSKTIDTFAAPPVSVVRFVSDELTAFCPVTHQPDFYHLEIEYRPNALCMESKSLKLYLQTFRESAQFAEHLAHEIARDIFDACHPLWVHVTLRQQKRGGLELTVECRIPLDG